MENGVYADISHDAYHAMMDRVSNSYLSRLDNCPAKARITQDDTPAMAFGRAFHSMILDGAESFNRSFAIAPDMNLRTKDGKEQMAQFAAENAEKTIITQSDNDKIIEMLNAAFRHPFALKLLAQGRSEVSVLWIDPETGIACRCRPDKVPDGNKGVMVDLKSVADASPKAFLNAVLRYGWHREAGVYIEGWNAINGKDSIDSFVLIAVEKEPPYRVEVYVLDDDFLRYGRNEFHRLLNIEKQCREDNFYPHYKSADPVELPLPQWFG